MTQSSEQCSPKPDAIAAHYSSGYEADRLHQGAGQLDRERSRELLGRFQLDDIDPTVAVGTLGIGKQQMVEIVRALSDEVRVLVLDEPTAALTSDETGRLFAWLRELAARGTTCVYVSHRMDEVFGLCERITVLRDGATVSTSDPGASEILW